MVKVLSEVILTVLALPLSGVCAYGQTPTSNYVKTETMLSADGSRKQTGIQYYDKKGRPSQLVVNGTGNGGWLRSYTEYDSWGRVKKESLPNSMSVNPRMLEIVTVATSEMSMVDDARYLYFQISLSPSAPSMYIKQNAPHPNPLLNRNSLNDAPSGPP